MVSALKEDQRLQGIVGKIGENRQRFLAFYSELVLDSSRVWVLFQNKALLVTFTDVESRFYSSAFILSGYSK